MGQSKGTTEVVLSEEEFLSAEIIGLRLMVTSVATILVVVIFRVIMSFSCQMVIAIICQLSHNVIVCQSKPI